MGRGIQYRHARPVQRELTVKGVEKKGKMSRRPGGNPRAAAIQIDVDIGVMTRSKRNVASRSVSPGPSAAKKRRLSPRSPKNGSRKGKSPVKSKNGPSGKGKRVLTPEERLENEVNQLICTFGDCDPQHIRTKLELLSGDPERSAKVYEDLTVGGYPKLKDKLRRQFEEQKEAELLTNQPSVQLLIKRYATNDALAAEHRKRKADGTHVTYNNAAVALFANIFRYMPVPHIRRVINKEQGLVNAHPQLKRQNSAREQRPNASGRKGTYLRKPRMEDVPMPEEPCTEFTWDRIYIERLPEIEEYKQKEEAAKTLRYMKAKALGELIECPICFEAMLTEDMLSCGASEHNFCKSCIHLTVNEQLGLGRSQFPCPDPQCEQLIPLYALEQALPPATYRRVEARVQEEQILKAAIPGMVTCPGCPYSVVFPEEAGARSVLQCENPHCLQTTCRFCKDVAHPPYTCEQRASAKVRLRQYIENKMAEAIIRTCVQCNRRFVKGGGCNRMVCPNCNTPMCYVCGAKLDVDGYSHFNSTNNPDDRCRVLDENLVHEGDLTKALPAAEKEFKKVHGEAKDLVLDFDPLADWKATAPPAPLPHAGFGFGFQH